MTHPWKGERPSSHSAVTRRDFVRRTAGLTAGVGALVWTAPAVRSVQVGNAGGSAAPTSTSETPDVDPTIVGNPDGPGASTTSTTTTTQPGIGPGGGTGATSDPTGGGGSGGSGGGGGLPLTGTNVARLAAASATAVVGGRLLMSLHERTTDGFGVPYDRPR